MDRNTMNREVERLVRLVVLARGRGDEITVAITMARLTGLVSRFGSTLVTPSLDRALRIVNWSSL
ncbi:MAG TPA: hypothetical protein VFB99_01635 [Vicinamibacterales bacterium]|nr:hypothetical protein [Vicinamibacterales bacterium]